MAAAANEEAGSVRAALNPDACERSVELAPGGKEAGHASESTQVGMIKCVFTGNGSVIGLAEAPWPEFSVGSDFAWRLGIRKPHVKRYGSSHADAAEG